MIKRDKPKMTSRIFSQATRRAGLSLPYIRKSMGGTGFGGEDEEIGFRHIRRGDAYQTSVLRRIFGYSSLEFRGEM